MRLFLIIWMFLMPIVTLSSPAAWNEFNSSLLIEVTRSNGIFTCSGVAVSPTLVLTAAHCLEGDVQRVRVFNQSVYDPKAEYFAVKDFKIHPKYKPKKSRYQNDIAKIHLESHLPNDTHILPIFKERIVSGEILRFGFGSRVPKKNIRTTITPVVKQMRFEDNVIELNDKFSFSGDSGGPVYIKKGQDTYILAIHSTLSKGPEGKFSYNPLLGNFSEWIFE